MKKAYIKYLLSLNILLLSFAGQVLARSHKSNAFFHDASSVAVANHHQTVMAHHASFSASIALETNDKDVIDTTEEEKEEKDELDLVKKTAANQHLLSSLTYLWNQYIFLNTLKSIPFDKDSIHFSPTKLFIIFRSFLI